MKSRISMITLGVRNLPAATEFYERGLGLPRIESGPKLTFFALSSTWLGLYDREALAKDATVPSEGAGFEAFALAHNVNSEKEVDAVVSQAVDAGADLVKKPQKVFWGGYSGYFKDLDGHLWEVAYNPLFWVGPKDETL